MNNEFTAFEQTPNTFSAPQLELNNLQAPQFDLLAFLQLDDDARDQMGTFAVALFIGALATLARVAVKRKNRWWLNMILFQGAIFVYWLRACGSSVAPTPWLTTIHGGLCWRNTSGEFQQIAFWGGNKERLFLNALVWLAILGNVVPAYMTGNEASRHMTHVKRRACNPLINHIIAGVFCVMFPFFVVTFQLPIMIPIAVILDIYHQITIHRLIANHDGIWVLRAVSMSLSVSKWIVILNMYGSDAEGMLDQMFIMSTGFLGTRAYAATAYILYYLTGKDIKTAEWYSIGLMLADVGIMGRCWGQMRISFWLTIVNCAAMHYHQMWKKFLHLRPFFVGACCVLTMSVAHMGNFSSLLFTIVWSFGNFLLPHFNRYRPAPPKDQNFTPTVSTRPAASQCPFAMLAKGNNSKPKTRVSGFLKHRTLSNSRMIVPKSAREASAIPADVFDEIESPEEYLMTPHSARSIMTPRTLNRSKSFSGSSSRRATPRSLAKMTPRSTRQPIGTISEETAVVDDVLPVPQSKGTKGRRSVTSSPCPSPADAAEPVASW